MSKKDDIKKLALAAATISAAIFAAKKVSDDEVKVLMPNRDENSLAYLLGDGFGNLALAYGLINHANLDPKNINIYTKHFNEFTKITEGENNYISFDNRFSEFNLKNTLEILKNITSEEEFLEISEKIAKKENPKILDLSLASTSKIKGLDEMSKKKLYKLILSPLDFDDGSSIEKYFLFSSSDVVFKTSIRCITSCIPDTTAKPPSSVFLKNISKTAILFCILSIRKISLSVY